MKGMIGVALLPDTLTNPGYDAEVELNMSP